MVKDEVILTQKQITEVTKLRRQGVSYEDIAKKMCFICDLLKQQMKIVNKKKCIPKFISIDDLKTISQMIENGTSVVSAGKQYNISATRLKAKLKKVNLYNPPSRNSKPIYIQSILEPKEQAQAITNKPLTADELRKSVCKTPTIESLNESRLVELTSKSIDECNNIIKTINSSKFFTNTGKLVIRRQALLATVYNNQDWCVDVFTRGWKTIADKLVAHLNGLGFEVTKDINDNSVIINWM